tara:strand:- start:975 stop:1610 length:636 start_codon:yes stop_codon:yes gene_type:complete
MQPEKLMFMPQYPIHAATIKADANLPTEYGNFRMRVFVDDEGAEHSLLSVGLEDSKSTPLVRIHSECLTGDAFGSLKCDCGPQLKASMARVQEEGCGAILYMRQEGRGIGLEAKIRAYALQDLGLDTLDANLALNLPADAREYSFCAEMLTKVGVDEVRLMTNNPLKVHGLRSNGIAVHERLPHIAGRCELNDHYLSTKKKRMGHLIPEQA